MKFLKTNKRCWRQINFKKTDEKIYINWLYPEQGVYYKRIKKIKYYIQ